ncbi:FMN-binding protein [Streptomyces sp. NPDC006193]|uniref:FMN-binding protein n=1 Tax=Streptomyces sp. NPDC006193 TaxID=3155717 RepID=UPI00339FBA0D
MRKSHPVRRVVLATAATVSGVVLLLSLKPASDPAAASAAGAGGQRSAAQEAPQGGAQAPAGSGTVTGDAVRTQYGPVQVRLTVSGGKITEAEAVRAPEGGLSGQKTQLAVPRLNQEAVAAQSARIDAVSGATYTSEGYRKSLQSALDRMKPAAPGASGAAPARTVTGKAVRTPYGPVQVRITVSGGKVTAAQAVRAPEDGLSGQKTRLAVPRLNQEAVAAGSADIDAVSGATYTSTGYRQSLQSALDQAGG